jgi:hypothetical protein
MANHLEEKRWQSSRVGIAEPEGLKVMSSLTDIPGI